mgnify:CR=1 FL=1
MPNFPRTDLAVEAEAIHRSVAAVTELPGVRAEETERRGFAVTEVHVLDVAGENALCKPIGDYYTLALDPLLRREDDAFENAAQTLAEVEDIYRPYKQKRRTRATIAREKGLAPLAELFSVEELQLGYNNLCDLSALTGHTALRRLILDHNALRDITALSGCTALEELDLSYNDLNSLAALRSLTQLRTLNITGNPALTADMVRSLQEALPACQIITDIDLSMPEPTPEPPAETPQP